MKKSIALGVENFKSLIEQNSYYVDKTKVIENLLDCGEGVNLFPRPRRFGKTLFMSMLENFFDVDKEASNKNLFEGLYIYYSKYKDIQNTYPVISLSFKDLKQKSFESVLKQFAFLMSDIYQSKRYVYESLEKSEQNYFDTIVNRLGNEDDLKISLRKLCNYLYRYFDKKVILLIDEYDVPIQEGYLDGFYEDVMDFLRSVLSSSLKTNNSLYIGVLTGVLRVSKESIFSDLNNLRIYDLMSKEFDEFFGFTEKETENLLSYYDLILTEKVRDMYDGYNFSGTHIYNPWSILNYASTGIFDNYWINTSGNDLIKDLLLKTDENNKGQLERIVQGENVYFSYNDKITYQDFKDYNNLNNILNILFSSGYLTINNHEEQDGLMISSLKVPNNEVKQLLCKIMNSTYQSLDISYNLYALNQAFVKNDKNTLEQCLNEMLQSMSFLDAGEMFYHGYMLGLFQTFLNTKNYVVKSNREAGQGRFDISVRKLDNSFGFICEFKLATTEKEMESLGRKAIKQMKEKEYYKELKLEKVENIYEFAFVFFQKKCLVR